MKIEGGGRRARSGKRDLFVELSEGIAALAEAREGKRTLRTHAVEYRPAPKVTPRELIRVREDLKLSRALFAIYLRTNVRTLENWEQGRAKPNAQAALLINLVKKSRSATSSPSGPSTPGRRRPRFHLWLEDVEVERAQAEPVSASLFTPRGIARCVAVMSAATALGTRLFGRIRRGGGEGKLHP